jgi:hypothetical protein
LAAPSADGILWITEDSVGKKSVFDLPVDHPALRSTGTEFNNWKKTEFFLGHERALGKRREDKILDEEVDEYLAKKGFLLRNRLVCT